MDESGTGERSVVLLVGGSPEPSSSATLRRAVQGCAAVVAIDRGLDRLRAAGLTCDLFCGDGDTVSPAGAAAVAEAERAAHSDHAGSTPAAGAAFDVVRYNPHKDDTDLGLALGEVARCWPGATVRATCLSGGHPDHLLGVIGRLTAYRPDRAAGERPEATSPDSGAAPSVELIEDFFEGRILHAGETWDLARATGRRFSFIPLAPETVVSEMGMRWELDHRHVPLLDDLGISNVIEQSPARITCHEGTLVCWLFA